MHTLIPNAAVLTKHLKTFAGICCATEVVLFEKTTFLVIATSSQSDDGEDEQGMMSTRYERTSDLIKAFKQSCARAREEFCALEVELPDFTAVLDEMTRNTYVLVIAHDPLVQAAALKLNIRMARSRFELLQGDGL